MDSNEIQNLISLNRKNQKGFATILVMVSAAVLFSLLAISLNGYVSWHKMNMHVLKESQEAAGKIGIIP